MSGRKSNLESFQLLASVSMSASVTSSATNILYLDNVGLQHNWSGAPVGQFTVQMSADYEQDTQGRVVKIGNWITLLQSDGTNFKINTGSASGQAYMDMNQLSAPWIRSVYTASSGTGLMSSFITAKMV